MKINFLLSVAALLLAQHASAACDKDDWQQLLRHADAPTVSAYIKSQHCDIDQSLDDVSKTPLVYAIDAGNRVAVQALLQAGANPNVDGYDGNTPLFYAVSAKNLNIVQDLIAKGADVNAATRTSEITVLMTAVLDSTPAVASYLIAHGASLSDTDKYGHKPIDYVSKLPAKKQAAMRAALKPH
ncbi:ankyrin repeat domain-containing protein [Chromobacterium subtsugae]|uniref:ankyrin repeat domain-containing protein n=1 Tax=Chromobacterium subtsugae TaxID=251747 RepID=UPI00069B4634|nr:ankyrin repeat domain-containing protein [Chromobacterium subtsugae]